MASLVKWLAFSGAHTVTGVPVATGTINFYVPGGTSSAVTAYADAAESSALAQPITLDAAGRAKVYIKAPADILVKDSTGATVLTVGYGESVASGVVTCTWGRGAASLTTALTAIEAFMAADPDPPTDTIHHEIVSSEDPSFEFNPTKTINSFHGTYAGVSTTFTITWPSPAPSLVRGTRYTLILHGHDSGGGVTCASSVVFPGEIRTSTPPASIVTLTTYSADFVAGTVAGGYATRLIQITPWVATISNSF